jgi:2-iminobutanoate/2-iminopropanoate deaminase
MEPELIETDEAPKAVAAYAQAVRANGFIFLSGQIPLDPATGQLVDGDVTVQARRVMDNLAAVLRAASCDFSRVAKATIYLIDMADFAKVNDVYASYFSGDTKPARAAIAVSALPRGARVEIEMIALDRR